MIDVSILGTTTTLETRPNQEKHQFGVSRDALVIAAHVHAQNASRLCWTKLLRWEERPTSTVRWERFVIPS